MFNLCKLPEPFVFENQEYWEYIPPGRGNIVPTSRIQFINGILYQWYQGMERNSGIWLKVPNIVLPDYEKNHLGLDLNIGDKVIHKSWIGSGCEKFPITVTDITHKKDGLYFGWMNNVVYPNKIIDGYRIDTRQNYFVKVC